MFPEHSIKACASAQMTIIPAEVKLLTVSSLGFAPSLQQTAITQCLSPDLLLSWPRTLDLRFYDRPIGDKPHLTSLCTEHGEHELQTPAGGAEVRATRTV